MDGRTTSSVRFRVVSPTVTTGAGQQHGEPDKVLGSRPYWHLFCIQQFPLAYSTFTEPRFEIHLD